MQVADMSHLYHEWKIHTRWVGLLEEELFQQGDLEKLKDMPISPMADRSSSGLSAMQVQQSNAWLCPALWEMAYALACSPYTLMLQCAGCRWDSSST